MLLMNAPWNFFNLAVIFLPANVNQQGAETVFIEVIVESVSLISTSWLECQHFLHVSRFSWCEPLGHKDFGMLCNAGLWHQHYDRTFSPCLLLLGSLHPSSHWLEASSMQLALISQCCSLLRFVISKPIALEDKCFTLKHLYIMRTFDRRSTFGTDWTIHSSLVFSVHSIPGFI